MKKLIALLLVFVMLLTLSAIPATAAESTVKIGYYSSLVKKVKSFDGIANINDFNAQASTKVYKITDAAGLKKLAEIVNGGNTLEGYVIYLANDITEVGKFTPIGANTSATTLGSNDVAADTYFKGTFDGQGHTVDGLVISDEGIAIPEGQTALYADLGLFGNTQFATVMNVIIGANCTVSGNGCGAGLIGRGYETQVYNVLSKATVTAPVAGGIVGYMIDNGSTEQKMTNCENEGSITGNNAAGGICGWNGSHMPVTRCRNEGSVVITKQNGADRNIGCAGIIGRLTRGSQSTLKDCINNGNISGTVNVGGILGYVRFAKLVNCYNYGTVTGTSADTTGNMFGAQFKVYFPDNANANAHIAELVNSESRIGQTDASLGVADVLATGDETFGAALPGADGGEEEDSEGAGFTNIAQNPGADNIGYSSARVEAVDLAGVVDMVNYDTAPLGQSLFKISTPEGLVKLAYAVNHQFASFAGCTIYLTNDIDMSGVTDFVGVGGVSQLSDVNGNPSKTFCGTFDGLGNMIENLHILNKNPTIETVGLFACSNGATIKNLIIGKNCSFIYQGTNNDTMVGALIGQSRGNVTIDNCWIRATVKGRYWTGGVIGRVTTGSTTVVNSTFSGDVTAQGGGAVGGFLCITGSPYTFTNCRSAGVVTLKTAQVGTSLYNAAAGFVGRSNNGVADTKMIYDHCVNNSTINTPGNAGGFAGILRYTATFVECVNYGHFAVTEDLPKTGALVAAYFTQGYTANVTNVETVADMAGQPDPTFYLELDYQPDYTPVADVPANPSKPPEETTEPSGGDDKDTETTAPDPSTDTADGETTAADETTAEDDGTEGDQKGCKSTAGIGAVALLMILGGAGVTFMKKKED